MSNVNDENDYTIILMKKYGINNVRGGKYLKLVLPKLQIDEVNSINEDHLEDKKNYYNSSLKKRELNCSSIDNFNQILSEQTLMNSTSNSSSNNYLESIDFYKAFINERLEAIEGHQVSLLEAYIYFKRWFAEISSDMTPRLQVFKTEMEAHLEKLENNRWKNLSIKI